MKLQSSLWSVKLKVKRTCTRLLAKVGLSQIDTQLKPSEPVAEIWGRAYQHPHQTPIPNDDDRASYKSGRTVIRKSKLRLGFERRKSERRVLTKKRKTHGTHVIRNAEELAQIYVPALNPEQFFAQAYNPQGFDPQGYEAEAYEEEAFDPEAYERDDLSDNLSSIHDDEEIPLPTIHRLRSRNVNMRRPTPLPLQRVVLEAETTTSSVTSIHARLVRRRSTLNLNRHFVQRETVEEETHVEENNNDDQGDAIPTPETSYFPPSSPPDIEATISAHFQPQLSFSTPTRPRGNAFKDYKFGPRSTSSAACSCACHPRPLKDWPVEEFEKQTPTKTIVAWIHNIPEYDGACEDNKVSPDIRVLRRKQKVENLSSRFDQSSDM
ncbi:hypothetical protein AJ80_08063 [Polytolypa hystricis UAMH7299]|uniref:Uncharacterized protein n=1 Tax=Polytolypa hystricis (strain UAMH7299) TaxID=1447883 RepID=A0A2B7XDR3_POLH7|nr:hypothetical protein AJ80_08063 [Polytolypa hystricis UAMH7299]